MLKLFALSIYFYLAISSHHSLNDLTPKQKAKWTLAVYMNGDNELESSITGDSIDKIDLMMKAYNPMRQNFGKPQTGDFHVTFIFMIINTIIVYCIFINKNIFNNY